MAHSLQIVVDSLKPHQLADWWAETLGWDVETTDESFIRFMIQEGKATPDQTTLHKGVLVWAVGAAISAPDADAGQPRILFQLSDEAKSGKNRVHWDVHLNGSSRAEMRAALEARGSLFLWEAAQGPYSWITMADPEGNEFCVS